MPKGPEGQRTRIGPPASQAIAARKHQLFQLRGDLAAARRGDAGWSITKEDEARFNLRIGALNSQIEKLDAADPKAT